MGPGRWARTLVVRRPRVVPSSRPTIPPVSCLCPSRPLLSTPSRTARVSLALPSSTVTPPDAGQGVRCQPPCGLGHWQEEVSASFASLITEQLFFGRRACGLSINFSHQPCDVVHVR